MKGREERDNKKREMTLKKIESEPDYMMGYYNSLYSKSENTKYEYVRKILTYLQYLKAQGLDTDDVDIFKSIKPSDINGYLFTMNNSLSKTASFYYALSNFFDYLECDEIIDKNPMDKVSAPKQPQQKDPVYLTKSEIKKMLYNIEHPPFCRKENDTKGRLMLKNQNLLLTILALETGLREGSLFEINLEDINMDELYITVVQKGETLHKAYFTEDIKDLINLWLVDREKILKAAKQESDALFVTLTGGRLYPSYFFNLLKWATANIDKQISPHKLRSTCATTIYSETNDIYITAEMLGHKNINNTRRYTKVTESRAKEASSIMSGIIFENN